MNNQTKIQLWVCGWLTVLVISGVLALIFGKNSIGAALPFVIVLLFGIVAVCRSLAKEFK